MCIFESQNLSSLALSYYDLMNRNKENKDVAALFSKGMWVCKDNPLKQILITGMNPSRKEKGECHISECSFRDCSGDYWDAMKSIMSESMLCKVAYLDLFPIHEGKQIKAEDKLKIEIAREILLITHKEIERIAPSLLLIANKRSAAYWGLYKWNWMDYDFGTRISDYDLPIEARGLGLDVYQIQGYKGNNDSIIVEESTSLAGTIAVNYGYHNLPYGSEKKGRRRPHTISPEAFSALYDFAIQRKKSFNKCLKQR